MAYNKPNRGEYVLNEEQVVSFLKDAVSRLENASESEIKTLGQIKKLFKSNVPFSRRSYVAAMLIKNATQGFKSNRYSNGSSHQEHSSKSERFNNAREENRNEERPARTPRVTIDPSEANAIFISVGRSRGVYPRDLVGLLVSVAGFDRSRIGDIRVLSNYSFIQLYAEDCPKAIKALNGYEYRGRKLDVDYSKENATGKDSSEKVPAEKIVEIPESEDKIPENVSNLGHADTSVNAEEVKLQSEQAAFAKAMSSSEASEEKPYSETADDGQVKSHFGDGAAY